MRPEILPGDKLYISALHPEELRIGDVFVFKKNGRLIAHRILKNFLHERRFLEKGDGKFQPYFVDYEDVIGKVIRVERDEASRELDRPSQLLRSRFIAFCSLNKYRLIIFLSQIKRRMESIAF